VHGLSESELLGKAIETTSGYQFVGIQEHFSDSVDLLCCALGWPTVAIIPHLNQGNHRNSINDIAAPLRSKIRKLNALDEELYLHCKKELQARKRQLFRAFMLGSRQALAIPATEPPPSLEYTHPQDPERSSVDTSLEVGSRQIEIIDVRVVGDESRANVIAAGEMAEVEILIGSHIDTRELTVGMELRNSLEQVMFGTNSFHLQHPMEVLAGQTYSVTYRLRLDVAPGFYCIGVALHTGTDHHLCCYHYRNNCTTLEVVRGSGAYFAGQTKLYPALEVYRVAPLSSWRAEMTLANPPSELFAGEDAEVPVNVCNCSSEIWHSFGLTPITCSYHIWNAEGRLIEFDGRRTLLPVNLKSGEQAGLSIQVAAPVEPGEYIIAFSLVQEGIAWFEEKGFTPPRIRVHVRKRQPRHSNQSRLLAQCASQGAEQAKTR
jgi:hypothetical protein